MCFNSNDQGCFYNHCVKRYCNTSWCKKDTATSSITQTYYEFNMHTLRVTFMMQVINKGLSINHLLSLRITTENLINTHSVVSVLRAWLLPLLPSLSTSPSVTCYYLFLLSGLCRLTYSQRFYSKILSGFKLFSVVSPVSTFHSTSSFFSLSPLRQM